MWNELVSFCESLPKKNSHEQKSAKRKLFKWWQMVVFLLLLLHLFRKLVEPTDENIRKLQEKHPAQDIPSDFVSASECVPIFIESSLVLKKLRSFNKGSAAGPSGIRASHILSAIQVHNQTPALEILTDFINHLAKG